MLRSVRLVSLEKTRPTANAEPITDQLARPSLD